ncbi:MAG TPA: ATP-binding protein [Thermosynergistes sp.]|nr:ATP-binding protein [Thermosynergistes sp.]
MLEDLSHSILDIAENAVNAEATKIVIEITEKLDENKITMIVSDNGKGMDEDLLSKISDPFVTSRKTRRVGLGIPFLRQAAEGCGGFFEIRSSPGKGTSVMASFRTDHIDCPPMGDLAATLITLLLGWPDKRWIFRYKINGRQFELDSDEIVRVLGDKESLRSCEVATWLKGWIDENLSILRLGGSDQYAQDKKS